MIFLHAYFAKYKNNYYDHVYEVQRPQAFVKFAIEVIFGTYTYHATSVGFRPMD